MWADERLPRTDMWVEISLETHIDEILVPPVHDRIFVTEIFTVNFVLFKPYYKESVRQGLNRNTMVVVDSY